MRLPLRDAARTFLRTEHLLEPAEAERALLLADTVLHDGLSRLTAAADRGDLDACHEAAHALKGNLLNLGLATLAEDAQAVVRAASQGDVSACSGLVAQFDRALVPFFR